MNLRQLLSKCVLRKINPSKTIGLSHKSHWPYFQQKLLYRALYFQSLYSRILLVPGVVVECGVGGGMGLAMWLSLSLVEGKSRHVWAFDSFEGFPPLADQDEATKQFEEGLKEYRQFDVPYVRKTLLQFGLNSVDIERNVSFAKGFIPDSCEMYNGGSISLLYIDLDIYEGYRDSLAFFYSRVAPGGIIAFDEYLKPLDSHKWPGAAKAINEFLHSHCLFESLQCCPLTGNRFIVKPEC